MHPLLRYLDRFLYLIGLFAVGALIVELGFHLTPKNELYLSRVAQGLVLGFVSQEVLRWYLSRDSRTFFRERWFEAIIALNALIFFIFLAPISVQVQNFHPTATVTSVTLIYLGVTQGLVFIAQLIKTARNSNVLNRLTLRPPQIFILSFLTPILIGTALLKLPKATTIPISWLDALFTATSAVCVTGLTVIDTGTAFTGLGKTILLCLFQIGGLGIMTLTITFATVFSGSIGIRERILMSELLSEDRVGEVRSLLAKIALFTFGIEAVGATLLYLSTGATFGEFDPRAFYEAVFHSVSAFCNAGFSIFSDGLHNHSVRANRFYASVIMGLIVIGGLGFPVLSNLTEVVRNQFSKERRRKILTTTSRLVLTTTFILITFGTFLVWVTERSHSFAVLAPAEQVFQSLFWSITSRTAGFNIWPTDLLSANTILVIMVLMFIGASPMSTGGGVKTVTLAVAFLNIRSQILGKSRVEVFGRQIAYESVHRCFAVVLGAVFLVAVGAFLIVVTEPNHRPMDLLFEVVSAAGTVGLTRGVTGELAPFSKSVLIFLMLAGRVGILMVLSSLFAPAKTQNYKLLKDNLIVS